MSYHLNLMLLIHRIFYHLDLMPLPFIVFLSTCLMLFLLNIKQKPSQRLPPGPSKLPLIGNLHQLGDKPHLSLKRLADKHGPLMFLQLGSVPTVVVSSARIAREMFKTGDHLISARPVQYVPKKITYDCSDIVFGFSGEHRRELKRIAMLEVLNAKRVQKFGAIRGEEVKSMIDAVAGCWSQVINLSDLALSLANNVICRVAYGEEIREKEGDKNRFLQVLQEMQHLLGVFGVADFFPWMGWLNKFNGLDAKLDKNFNELDKYFDKVLEQHRDLPKREHEDKDLVHALLHRQRDPSQAIILRNEHIKGLLSDMFIAGSDTAAATIVWIMAELVRNPTAMKKAQDEVRAVANGKPEVLESDLPRLVYMKMVIKEGLRLHPAAPLLIPRETTDTFTVGEYEIPAKTRLFVNAKAIATDPNSWEDPNEFRPERFMGSSIDFKGHNFEFLPFGFGRRICPGISFATVLVELAVANLLCCFDWSLPEGMRAEDMDMEETVGIVMHKETPLCLVASPPS
ncbi:cytochrome P450 71A9-like [Diospyros lotus]|uniref:cytochrome P450 71A9-like n=1 Tax=Diospyros lotus TaxID=55363 RepID=UPI00225543FB|nr:cytochrome P450 71A9-like [Diospyros lotus]